MKLLTRLRELRNQHTDSSIYDYLNDSFKLDNEIIGIGATTSPDITRLNLEIITIDKSNSSKK